MSGGSLAFPTGDRDSSALFIEKVAPSEVQAGQPFGYQIRVTNLTSMALDNVVVEEAFSKNFELGKTTPASSGKADQGVFNLGSLAPHGVKLIEVSGQVKTDGPVSTCSSVSYNSGLCMVMNAVSPKLSLKAKGPSEAKICDPVEATYVVTNSGSGTARNVVVSGDLPDGMTTKSGARSFEKKFAALASGESKEFSIPASVAREGSFQYGGIAVAEGGLNAKSEAITTMVKQPLIAVAKAGTQKSFAGRTVRYQIDVINNGTAVAENTIIEDEVPRNFKFKSASHGGKVVGKKIQWKLGSLAPKQTKKLTVELKAGEIGTYSSDVLGSADCAQTAKASIRTVVEGIPAILLEVIDEEDPIEVGESVVYEIKVFNQGSAADQDIRITCTLPPNVSYVTSTGPTKASLSGSTLNFAALPSLAPQKTAIYKVTVKADAAASARFKVSMNSRELAASGAVEETEATNYYE